MKTCIPNLLLFVGVVFILTSCSSTKNGLTKSKMSGDLVALAELMTGSFNSAEQAKLDTNYFDISLTMYPIWEGEENVCWLYVEQAVTDYIKRPYRQRVYRVSQLPSGEFESRVYELSEPEKFVHSWESPEIFDEISESDLLIREGCAVMLKPEGNGCYKGSTIDKNCKSTLRGASYATSVVTVCADQLLSWDQGWNDGDEQVWGATKGGYVFKKIK